MNLKLSAVALFALLNGVATIVADDAATNWNQFRGPTGDGVSAASSLPIEFDESRNVRWKVAIPDQGWSSPVVWEDEIWLTSGNDATKELRAICVDLENGRIKKSIKVFDMVERRVDPSYRFDSPHLNSPATPTPVVEADRVYVSFGSQGLACLDRLTGQKIWERRDLRVYQPVRQGSSPIVDDQRLYVAFDGTDDQFFVALDKQTGVTQWKMNRAPIPTDQSLAGRMNLQKIGKPGDSKKAFATASLIEVNGERQLIAPGGEVTIAYDPDTGAEIWKVRHPGGFNVAARPLFAHGMTYIFTSGLTGHLMAIKPDGSGDVTDSHVQWSITRSTPRIPSPIILGDRMFMVTDGGGIVRCLDAKNGEEIWKKRLGGDHWASPFYADGKLYFCSKTGEVHVLNASETEPEDVTENKLNARFLASPAVAGSSLLLRSTTHLYCLESGYQRTPEQVAADIYPPAPVALAKQSSGKEGNRSVGEKLESLKRELGVLVKAGALTRKEAAEIYQAANKKP